MAKLLLLHGSGPVTLELCMLLTACCKQDQAVQRLPPGALYGKVCAATTCQVAHAWHDGISATYYHVVGLDGFWLVLPYMWLCWVCLRQPPVGRLPFLRASLKPALSQLTLW